MFASESRHGSFASRNKFVVGVVVRLGIISQLSEGNGMNKAELVDAVASAANLSKADAGRAVDAVLSSISGSLSSGQQVSIVGFGTFSVKHRAARAGRNPRTGETIQIAASNVPGFKAGKALKEAVN